MSLLENKLKNRLAQRIKSLDKDDFRIISETKNGKVNVSVKNSGRFDYNGVKYYDREMDLDGNTKVCMLMPINSLYLEEAQFPEWIVGVNRTILITEQQYNEYIGLIEDYDVVETQSFYLKIKLSNTDVITMINKWTKYFEKLTIETEYEFERYNVLNLITDMQPFSDDEIDNLIEKIKDRMIESLCVK